jgi:hypothetical protein
MLKSSLQLFKIIYSLLNRHLIATEWIVPLKCEQSAVVFLARLSSNILSLCSLLTWFKFLMICIGRKIKPWHIELWVFILCIFLFISLCTGQPYNAVILWIGIGVLVDVIGALFRDIVTSPIFHSDKKGGYTQIYDKTRWFFMSILNVVEIVFCFAVLALYYGDQFNPHITDPVSAIYFSVGYGDILPIYSHTKVLVCFQLFIFLLFLSVKLPMAISVMRIKEIHDY